MHDKACRQRMHGWVSELLSIWFRQAWNSMSESKRPNQKTQCKSQSSTMRWNWDVVSCGGDTNWRRTCGLWRECTFVGIKEIVGLQFERSWRVWEKHFLNLHGPAPPWDWRRGFFFIGTGHTSPSPEWDPWFSSPAPPYSNDLITIKTIYFCQESVISRLLVW